MFDEMVVLINSASLPCEAIHKLLSRWNLEGCLSCIAVRIWEGENMRMYSFLNMTMILFVT